MLKPKSITADKTAQTLSITWENGMTVAYPFQILADNCRCANCNEERAALAEQGKPFAAKSSELLSVEAVGSYGLSIVWKGGCRFGIFTYDYLSGELLDAMVKAAKEAEERSKK
ncbi:MAG TPA: DUF971 domain-containing protein [Thermoflexales bacterium]|nr:DUF971 domain-containing protein [Thermoflexales bacterium]HQW33988.1 DUF971 domain-containing protein [Thermoflexales bacterium]HQZ23214.1 DUF971 domain-containing protein [Thermoflexales bacterium]